MIYIHNAIICILVAVAFVMPLAYHYGKEKGYSQGYSEAEKFWKETVLKIEKSAEERIDIFEKEMCTEKNRYHDLCEKHYEDFDATCSGILETED